MTRPLILPPLRRTAYEAKFFAITAHGDQVDKAGGPYWQHLARVAGKTQALLGEASPELRDEALQIAWLHDVIEDTDCTVTDLFAEGFGPQVVHGVEDLTKREGTSRPYLEWIEDITLTAALPTILVKIADVEDNSDPARLALLDEATRARLERKYAPALVILREAAQRLGWTPPLEAPVTPQP